MSIRWDPILSCEPSSEQPLLPPMPPFPISWDPEMLIGPSCGHPAAGGPFKVTPENEKRFIVLLVFQKTVQAESEKHVDTSSRPAEETVILPAYRPE